MRNQALRGKRGPAALGGRVHVEQHAVGIEDTGVDLGNGPIAHECGTPLVLNDLTRFHPSKRFAAENAIALPSAPRGLHRRKRDVGTGTLNPTPD